MLAEIVIFKIDLNTHLQLPLWCFVAFFHKKEAMIYWVEVKYEQALSNWNQNLQGSVWIILQEQGFNRLSTEEENKKKSLHYPAHKA